MEQIKEKKENVKVVGISKELLYCDNCSRHTYTVVRLVSGKKKCTCMHCNQPKKEPTGELTRY